MREEREREGNRRGEKRMVGKREVRRGKKGQRGASGRTVCEEREVSRRRRGKSSKRKRWRRICISSSFLMSHMGKVRGDEGSGEEWEGRLTEREGW